MSISQTMRLISRQYMSQTYRQNRHFLSKLQSFCRARAFVKNRRSSADIFAIDIPICDSHAVHRSYDFAAQKGLGVEKKVAAMLYHGLSLLASAVRTVPGRMAKDWRAGMWMVCAPGLVGFGAMRSQAQEQMGLLPPAESSTTVSSEHFRRIESRPMDEPFLEHRFKYELSKQFEKRDLQFMAINEFLRNQDLGEARERFGKSARRKIERSLTRTVSRYLEATPIGTTLRDEPWKERLFDIAKDAVTEETQTLDGQLGEDDPHVDYDFDSAVVRKPAWKERVNFFVRPFSLHPNAGIGLKIDNLRAQVKAYHDEVKFSALVPITHNWNFYTSARLPDFSLHEASFNIGFQHPLRFPGNMEGVVQYGVSVRKHEFEDESKPDVYAPHAFFAFALDF
jgi:hypothetical protein